MRTICQAKAAADDSRAQAEREVRAAAESLEAAKVAHASELAAVREQLGQQVTLARKEIEHELVVAQVHSVWVTG